MAVQVVGGEVNYNPKDLKPEKLLAAIANTWKDPTSISLIFSNILVLFFAVTENTGIMTILWVYWCQSVIIGIFNFFKIITLKDFSAEGVKTAPQYMATKEKLQKFLAFFFVLHYGGFHLVYAFFLANNSIGAFLPTGTNSVDFNFVLLAAAVFFVNHLFSFLYYRNKQKENIGIVFIFPYARIIPMHLTIILGAAFVSTGIMLPFVLAFFLLLKTAADLVMHAIEHPQPQITGGI